MVMCRGVNRDERLKRGVWIGECVGGGIMLVGSRGR